jgi:hypothetical protein
MPGKDGRTRRQRPGHFLLFPDFQEMAMSDGLRLDIELDIESSLNGWATVRLTVAEVCLEFIASYTPRDSIGELAQAAAGLLAGVPEQIVVWNTEPEEYEVQFSATGGRTQLKVRRYPDYRRRGRHIEALVASVDDDTIRIVRAIWRGLRRLCGAVTAEEFVASWGHPFPAATVERIGDQLRAIKFKRS